MPSKFTVSLWDYDKEDSSVSVEGATLTDLNIVAQSALMDDIQVAIAGVSLGEIFKTTRVADYGIIAGSPPNDVDAQREKKWLVRMHDAVTFKAHKIEIPCADLSLLDGQARGKMDETSAEYIALKAALEAFVLTEIGNAIVVDECVFVGRNL